MPASLHSRLASVEASIEKVSGLIRRLYSFGSSDTHDDDERINLSTEIHQDLGEIEEEMEVLRVETHPLDRRRYQRRESVLFDAEAGRAMALMAKIEEDLKMARSKFRRAQIEAKRSSEKAKNRQRQLLFQPSAEGEDVPNRRTPRFTHGDLVASSSKDVTAALRQTHHLMQAELSRSQFAQEALEQSNKALSSLSESYTNLDTLLASSKSLVSSLVRSQKSDTWYLETAFYILIGTISWLIFRRWLYGPLWWIVWLPLKIAARITFTIFGVSSGVSMAGSKSVVPTKPLMTTNMGATATNSLWNPDTTKKADVNGIPDMAEDIKSWTGADNAAEENERPTTIPNGPKVYPNPKKRMWEGPHGHGDEL
ncbi:Sec20 domain-containing protein [Nannizzia gypsea CBS 118893]|uniref:Sec20 domain-containing protein n=1 Tax=Arthroderma gypseum (strain ATCC MYA-4604 / CBS 118893) TaxID=535722 RepID=E4V0S2_ARTGP|nr:Sec20 domain-containing protein [Nannizzia gypsea CBS 118893]EFR03637.1 Sec20 domain-containing protein [Nannizzia gypsea CBS 118893]